ncbi:hypothetical protein DCAR_0522396 [Daucus carota subsp. sativus]|uniref:Uncharacterized protein n=1 Tax=Daucus carota subsp. sativus TaxID=79200 RepID=A0A164ZSG4_DAUCS|nr:hypothetical protein DCAR_0522396 [Daucus carota subsp. sativus]
MPEPQTDGMRFYNDPNYAAARAAHGVMGIIVILIFVVPCLWLGPSLQNQSSIVLSLEDFMINDVQSSNFSAPNQTFIYFKLHLENSDDHITIHYGNLSLSFSYYRGSDNIVQLANYTIQRFHQDSHDKAHPQASVVLKQGLSWQGISRNATSVAFRVDLAGGVRFTANRIRLKKLKIMAGAKMEVDPVTGKRISKKAVRLKHMIKSHLSVGVIIYLVYLGTVGTLIPFVCYFFFKSLRPGSLSAD